MAQDGLFDDGKDEAALRTIGEVCKALDLKAHVVRYWEQQFPMLEPLKRSGGRRYYRPADVALLRTIDQLVNRQGYTLKGAAKALRDGEVQDRSDEARSVPDRQVTGDDASLAEVVAQLKTIRGNLAAALER
ncbi:putative HTH-type transcriptional regulator in himA 3'region [Alteripontixanthobacter maritimus]|uniref:Putative HTH-type transcriptional regulator in himA 3'region n=1 Tax=Alteripontixanthobacter maritimus TaxID=2161824 RepID=A0A369Q4C3_9SPHN|nr:MerR family transcriptional regulator [Alteripontixanthobacter maritimus]RDC59574.1 putative HTH-type transcriptional regulator in himA 3'region [Alteripontixanthobacter maritimus]